MAEAANLLQTAKRAYPLEALRVSVIENYPDSGCPGHYERRLIVHTVKQGRKVLVFEDVPADVCDVCSDTVLTPETVRHLETLLKQENKPRTHAPVFAYA